MKPNDILPLVNSGKPKQTHESPDETTLISHFTIYSPLAFASGVFFDPKTVKSQIRGGIYSVNFVLIVNKHVISFSVKYAGTRVYQKLTKNTFISLLHWLPMAWVDTLLLCGSSGPSWI